jgi:MFS family permease
VSAARNRLIFTAAGFLRASSTSVVGISIGLHLARRALNAGQIGFIISLGLAGAALAALAATFLSDRMGAKWFLLVLTSLSVAGTLLFAFSETPAMLAVAAFFGMLNGMGKDRGAALVIEQAALPATTTDSDRTKTIAVYTMMQDLGHAFGALLVSAPAWFRSLTHVATPATRDPTFFMCALASLASLFLYAALSCTAASPVKPQPLSQHSRGIIVRLASLFAIDSLAGGFLTTAMLSYFFFERFQVGEGVIGALFFGARLMNALSHLGAAWLAKRIGLVNTMVFTHIPSSILLMTVSLAPNFAVAAVLFLLREGLVEMDVPTRQSYVMAVVQPHERTLAAGLTNLVRLGAWAVAPAFAGILMKGDSLFVPLVIGGAMKITYDVLLWRAFRGLKAPEEKPG